MNIGSLGGSSPLCANYNISIDKVGKSKHNKNFIKIQESKERQHVSALYCKAIIKSDMEN